MNEKIITFNTNFILSQTIVNSEVTIHDVRRCTITEVPEEVRKWIVSTFSRQEQDESERKSKFFFFDFSIFFQIFPMKAFDAIDNFYGKLLF